MKSEQYTEEVLKTESVDYGKIQERFTERNIRLLHAAIGMSTEANEFLDQLKKHLFYGAELDEVNIVEELGDNLWYVEVAMDEINFNINAIRELNIAKLRNRYGDKFSKEKALNRDLNGERKVLEDGC